MSNHQYTNDFKQGKYVVIEEGAEIGKGVEIGHHTVILSNTRIEDGVKIGANCIIGITPGGNTRMRNENKVDTRLLIKKNATIGNGVSLYSGSTIHENVFIGDHASVREKVTIGRESVVGRGAMIELNSIIGKRCTIQTLAYITGDTILEDDVFIGPCVSMANDKYMGAKEIPLQGPIIRQKAKIGNNASLLPGVTIGHQAIVGAGAVVTKNVPDYTTVAGIPAKPL
ncbi:MAG: N-acetyltransferase [Bacillaceae bacterium]|nr:N-acetyltransferase [Bacillaceae bacterium]